jgi:hypothetical protein
VVGVPLILLCGGWVYRRTGSVGAAAAAGALAGLSPNVVAHSALATTDAAFTLFFLAALAAIAWHAARPTAGRFLAAGSLVGLAVASKYNGVLLLPVGYVVEAVAEWTAPNGRSIGRRAVRLLTVHPLRQVGIGVVAFAVCWATTGFALAGKPVLDTSAADTPAGAGPRKLVGNGRVGDAVIDFAHTVRPPAPVAGFVAQLAHLKRGPDEGLYPTYLFGEFYPRGHKLYFVWGGAVQEYAGRAGVDGGGGRWRSPRCERRGSAPPCRTRGGERRRRGRAPAARPAGWTPSRSSSASGCCS